MPHHRTPANSAGDGSKVSPVDIERALKGATYPATREELADHARSHQAKVDVVRRIRQLPGEPFASEAAALTAYSRGEGQGKHRGMR
jgi:Protein of unknown function (DUF2795)